MFTITETDAGWVLAVNGTPVGEPVDRYEDAVQVLAEMGPEILAAEASDAAPDGDATPDGLLPVGWMSPDDAGIAFSEETGDGRDFTGCDWTWRDPGESLLPLMLQTETEVGHFGAVLAGFIESLRVTSGTPHAVGRFYDSENGRAARDLLLDGRRFGVSLDPGAVDYEVECIEEDEDGWCTEAKMTFLAYQIIGLTMTPFPGFARAAIVLDEAAAEEEETETEPVAASGAVTAADIAAGAITEATIEASTIRLGSIPCDDCGDGSTVVRSTGSRFPSIVASGSSLAVPLRPPRPWFDYPEADLARWRRDPESEPGSVRVMPEGRLYAYLAAWGECHTGTDPSVCLLAPRSQSGYADFHLGYVICDDDSELAVGRLTVGTGHADRRLSFRGAAEHYDHTGHVRADIRVGEDSYGIWCAGAVRPGTTDEQVRELRAASLSGDWRHRRGGLELCAALGVNGPGFIAPRALVASGEPLTLIAAGHARPRSGLTRTAAMPLDPEVEYLVRKGREEARARLRAAGAVRRSEIVARLRGVSA